MTNSAGLGQPTKQIGPIAIVAEPLQTKVLVGGLFGEGKIGKSEGRGDHQCFTGSEL